MPAAPDVPEERDLNFQPVVNPRPRRLTVEQVAQYNTLGYVKPFGIYSAAAAQQNRAYFDYLLAEVKAHNDGSDSYAINGYHALCRGIYDIVTQPAILDCVQDIVGPDIICWGSHFFCKLPHDPKAVPWHQDASYWPLTPARTVTVWLAIDDADEENSCMHVIPGTHTLGRLQWRQTDRPAVLGQEIIGAARYGRPVPIDLRAGEISLHADMIVHGSEPNRSDRQRCGLTIRYCPPLVRALNPAWAINSIICRGRDPLGHWANQPRPAGEQIPHTKKPKPIGGN